MLTGLSSPCGFASSAWLGVATDKSGATASEWSGRSGVGGASPTGARDRKKFVISVLS